MVTFLPARGAFAALEETAPNVVQQLLGSTASGYEQEKENKASEKLGINLRGIKDPAMRQLMAKQMLKNQGEQQLFNLYDKLGSNPPEINEPGIEDITEAEPTQSIFKEGVTQAPPEQRPSTTQEQKPKAIKGKESIFQPKELPQKTKRIPPIGPLSQAANLQHKELMQNRNENVAFAEPYLDTTKLNTNLSKLKEAERLIEHGDISNSVIQRGIVAILEGNDSELAELMKTPDQQKLFSLLKPSIRTKDIGGSNPSTKEVMLELSGFPSYLKGKEANRYIIRNMVREAEKNVAKSKAINELSKHDQYMDTGTFRTTIENKVSQLFPDKITIRLPDGRIGQINADAAKEAVERGAEVLNE